MDDQALVEGSVVFKDEDDPARRRSPFSQGTGVQQYEQDKGTGRPLVTAGAHGSSCCLPKHSHQARLGHSLGLGSGLQHARSQLPCPGHYWRARPSPAWST